MLPSWAMAPWLDDYRCPAGHVTEALHMGSRDTTPLSIPCGLGGCEAQAERVISPVWYNEVTRGNHDFNERRKKRIRARNDEYMRKEGKEELVERNREMLRKNTSM